MNSHIEKAFVNERIYFNIIENIHVYTDSLRCTGKLNVRETKLRNRTARLLENYEAILEHSPKSFFSRCINNMVNEGRLHSIWSLLHGWSHYQPYHKRIWENPKSKLSEQHAQHQTQDWKRVETLYTPQNHKKLNAMNKTILNIHKAEQRAKKACQLYLNTIFVEKILLPVLNNHDKITSLLNKLVKLSAWTSGCSDSGKHTHLVYQLRGIIFPCTHGFALRLGK